jgi:hypothetical protein
MLQDLRATHNVKMVVVSIGGNDFNFASVVQSCVHRTSLRRRRGGRTTATTTRRSRRTSLDQRRRAAGQDHDRAAQRPPGDAQRRVCRHLLDTRGAELPVADPGGLGFRYSQSGYTRQNTGGCGFWNKDADWANATALPTINGAVAGAVPTRACRTSSSSTCSRLQRSPPVREHRRPAGGEGPASWQSAGAVDKTEWIDQIRTVSTATSNYYIQESLHPNYWGQLALRNCVRQAWNVGAPKGGSCTISATGLLNGEPRMKLN